MTINELKIHHLRNIKQAELRLSPQFNVFFGQNGSGKTSIIEAIYYLSVNRSFRSHVNQRIISFNEQSFSLFAELQSCTIGVQKSLNQASVIKLSGEKVRSAVDLAHALPVLLINSDTFQFLNAGSQYRRQYIDWALFHMEHSFVSAWQRYRRALKQRNQAIKLQATKAAICAWDHELIENNLEIDRLRRVYIGKIQEELNKYLDLFLPNIELTLNYYDGGVKGRDYASLLTEKFESDCLRGVTQYGAHKADIIIKTKNNFPAKDILSRGQQKTLLIALILAKLDIIVSHEQDIRPVLLIDDIAAELDKEILAKIATYLKKFQVQTIITQINKNDIDLSILPSESKMFHVEHGLISEIVFLDKTD